MRRTVDVNSYLPPVVKEAREFKQIAKSENPEFQLAWDKVDLVWANQYIMDCTIDGVLRWENMLNIMPLKSDTLYDRKLRILTYVNKVPPFTIRTLINFLLPICGEDHYHIDLDLETQTLTVTLVDVRDTQIEETKALLDSIVPANLYVILCIKGGG